MIQNLTPGQTHDGYLDACIGPRYTGPGFWEIVRGIPILLVGVILLTAMYGGCARGIIELIL